jgi:hypothetical protein
VPQARAEVRKASARQIWAPATIAYPSRQEAPAPRTDVMMTGPIATPSPKNACSQFMCRGPNAVAAYALSPASIAPPPNPASSAHGTIVHRPGDAAYPARAMPAIAVLAPSSQPTPTRAMVNPATTLEVRYPAVPANSSRPTDSVETRKVVLIDGQPTPSRPSGRPRLMNAK